MTEPLQAGPAATGSGSSMMSPHATGSPAGVPRSDPAPSEPPLKDVLVELWQNMEKLFRQEIALASAEIEIKARKLKADATSAAIGAGLLVAGSLALVAAVILLLDLVMAAWLAALITGGAAAGIGFALIQSKKPSANDVIPERSVSSIKQDLQTFRESTK
jgi:cytochrome c-type biogenesis protein CcmH/NrfG